VSQGGYLLLRRAGALWGVANREVEGLARQGEGYRLQVAGQALAADEILGVVAALEVRPLAPVVARFWPEPAGGWAVSGRLPVVLVDPRRPPRALVLEGGDLHHGD
jgi:hypothetical protein